MNNIECVLRIVIALILGYAIGFERKIRYNDAGPRTHAMVSMGACIFLIVSLYGFTDGTYDTSRVAASIVTGISFLGAGNIVYNRGSLHGLTTAAGIWVTAGIGMCAGSGKLILAISATLILIVFQLISHIPIAFLSNRNRYILKISYVEDKNEKFLLEDIIAYNKLLGCKYKKDKECIHVCVTVLINTYKKSIADIVEELNKNEHVVGVEFLDRK